MANDIHVVNAFIESSNDDIAARASITLLLDSFIVAVKYNFFFDLIL